MRAYWLLPSFFSFFLFTLPAEAANNLVVPQSVGSRLNQSSPQTPKALTQGLEAKIDRTRYPTVHSAKVLGLK